MLCNPESDLERIPVSSAGQYWILRTLNPLIKVKLVSQPLAFKLPTLKLFSLTTGVPDSYLALPGR